MYVYFLTCKHTSDSIMTCVFMNHSSSSSPVNRFSMRMLSGVSVYIYICIYMYVYICVNIYLHVYHNSCNFDIYI